MLRLFIKQTEVRCGVTRVSYSSILHSIPELERALTAGGYGEDACEFFELVGAEVVEPRDDDR